MTTAVSIGLRALIAGVLVTAFSVLGQTLAPKRFAGVFAGAPSVALANLAVVAAIKGTSDVADGLAGMILGATAFALAAFVGALGFGRLRSLGDSLLIWATWGAFVAASVVLVR